MLDIGDWERIDGGFISIEIRHESWRVKKLIQYLWFKCKFKSMKNSRTGLHCMF